MLPKQTHTNARAHIHAHKHKHIYIYIYIYIRGSLYKFQNFFRMGTFIDSTHMKL